MMSDLKNRLIEQYLQKDLEIGELVYCNNIGYQKDKEYLCKIISLDPFIVENERTKYTIDKKQITEKFTRHIGIDPFDKFFKKISFVNFNLECILSSCGFNRRRKIFKTEKFGEVEVSELNWNPYIFDKENNKKYYQRDFCWEESDKKLLIDSIYAGIDIGKIIIKKYSWKYLEDQLKIENKEIAFKDIVDGKQRLSTIIDFIQDKFTDSNGYVFSDLSDSAQGDFMDYQGLIYGELSENCSVEDVLKSFLMINFSGKPQSAEHINHVKEILNTVK